MEQLNILSAIIFTPLVGVVAMFFLRETKSHLAKPIALVVSFLVLALSIYLLISFKLNQHDFQFTEAFQWLSQFGIQYVVGVDGISILLVLLASLLIFVSMVVSSRDIEHSRAYFGMLLLLETGILGVFLALDGILFYVFWELMLVPIYFLISIWGGKKREESAIKLVLFTMVGSLLMLVAIIYLGLHAKQQLGEYTFLFSDWAKLQLSFEQEMFLFVAFALAFAIKIPIFPFHNWLPSAHISAPTAVTVILSGIVTKLGVYGLIRFCVPIFPQAVAETANIFMCFGVITMIYGALIAWRQTDLKSLFVYSSLSHVGFCVVGYGALSIEGMQGVILLIISHSLIITGLFLFADALQKRYGTYEIAKICAIGRKMPFLASMLFLFVLASIAFPLTSEFVAELLILLATFKESYILGGLVAIGITLCAVYMLSAYRSIVFGADEEEIEAQGEHDINWNELVVFIPLFILILVIGVYPQPLFDIFLSRLPLFSFHPCNDPALNYNLWFSLFRLFQDHVHYTLQLMPGVLTLAIA